MKNVVKERYWDLSNSVYKDWRKDNEQIYEKCLEHDFKFWKVPKFLKDPDELEEVKKVIQSNFPILKDYYQYLIAVSNFPGIANFDFMQWTTDIKIPDEKHGVPHSAVKLVFEAAIYQDKTLLAGSSNPESGLCRFEFLESVVRLAKAKFIATGVEKSYVDAVKRIIKEHIIKLNPCEAW